MRRRSSSARRDMTDGHIDRDTVAMLAAAHGEKRWQRLVDLLRRRRKVGERTGPDGTFMTTWSTTRPVPMCSPNEPKNKQPVEQEVEQLL